MKIQRLPLGSENQKTTLNKISLTSAIFFAGIAGYSYFAFLPLFLNSKGFSAGEITFIMTWIYNDLDGRRIGAFLLVFRKIKR